MRFKNYLLLLGFFLITKPTTAQYNWIPTSIPAASSRYDDMAWRNPELGYVIDHSGRLRKTTDGGNSWILLQGPEGKWYRSINFLTDQTGFIGKLQPSNTTAADTSTLYKTTDAGQTWAPIAIPSVPASVQGFCGMSAVNSQVLYACGRYHGPAHVYKTTDGGTSWTSINMSAYAKGLIDCYFWSPDSGIVVGHNGSPWNQGNSIILFTGDGGQTWQNKYTSNRIGEMCWKISFPSENTGYVSIWTESGSQIFVLKTTDKAQTWLELPVAPDVYYAEGIGFMNDSVGWLGGGISNLVYHTTDGGQTWSKQPVGSLLNRFRFFGNSLAYVSGADVYKLDLSITGTAENVIQKNPSGQLQSIYPNPSGGNFWVTMHIKTEGQTQLALLDALGREVKQLHNQFHDSGRQNIEVSVPGLAPGLYILQLHTQQGAENRRLEIVR